MRTVDGSDTVLWDPTVDVGYGYGTVHGGSDCRHRVLYLRGTVAKSPRLKVY
jgi:hypothetical protein